MKRETERTFDGRMANGINNFMGPVDWASDDEKTCSLSMIGIRALV
ncbi:hypothetical protein OAG43_00585 [Verrucomicrobia bacterium]|nr:hypothetical protein [Verrucomicrobiota bacterium]